MRKYISFCLLWLTTSFVVQSQQTELVQYWVDNPKSAVTGKMTNGSFKGNVDIKTLRDGIHMLTYRVKDDAGRWSAPRSSLFFKDTSASTACKTVEYWIDTTDGRNSAAMSANMFSSEIDMNKISDGIHLLSYRVQDDAGHWSAPRTSIFFKNSAPAPTAVTTIEYWVDTPEKKTSAPMESGVFNAELDMATLSEGIHTISYRVQDDAGHWSAPRTSVFFKNTSAFVPSLISGYEYWVNDDTENRINITLETPASPYELTTLLSLDGMELKQSKEDIALITDNEGNTFIGYLNSISFRFSDTNGNWSELHTDTFGIADENPNLDLSALIINPDATKQREGWEFAGTDVNPIQSGCHYFDDESPYFSLGSPGKNSWDASMSQTVVGLPAGNYIVRVKSRATIGTTATIHANAEMKALSICGEEGGEIWAEAPDGSQEKGRNFGKGFGWNKTSVALTTDGGPLTIKVCGTASSANGILDVVDFELARNEDSSGISDVIDDDNHGLFSVVDGEVVAADSEEWFEVYNISGMKVCEGRGRSSRLERGIYIVRIAGKSVKVII